MNDSAVFVFGSNEAGRHGAGAARFAVQKHGAICGQGYGRQGASFGIPTKDRNIVSLRLDEVASYVAQFIGYARAHPDESFQVTRVGCGLAGFTDEQIAPLFRNFPTNCTFDEAWKPWLGSRTYWGHIG